MKKTHYLMLSLLTTLPAVAANDFVAVIFNDVNSYSIKESTVVPSFIEVVHSNVSHKDVFIFGETIKYYDDGGLNNSYSNDVNSTTTFFAGGGKVVKATINYVRTEDGTDSLKIYDGTSSGTLLTTISSTDGSSNGQVIYSTDFRMTFEFISDSVNVEDGWEIVIEEVTP